MDFYAKGIKRTSRFLEQYGLPAETGMGCPPSRKLWRAAFASREGWSWREESNLQPAVYKTAALPIELRQRPNRGYTEAPTSGKQPSLRQSIPVKAPLLSAHPVIADGDPPQEESVPLPTRTTAY